MRGCPSLAKHRRLKNPLFTFKKVDIWDAVG